MDFTAQFDAISVSSLRAAGGTKWVTHPGAIGAFVAEMDFGVAPVVAQALHRLVDDARFGYTPRALEQELAHSYAQFCARRYGWAIEPEQVRPLPDVLAAMSALIESYTTPGSAVIVPTPAYMPFLTLPSFFDRDVIQVPMALDAGRYVYDLDALAAAFDRGGELLVLCNPHNPIGRVLEPPEMLAVAAVVEAKGGRVFSDEIHAPLVYPGHHHVPYASLDARTAAHTVTATSASKAFNIAGLKCAQIVFTNPEDQRRWARAGRWVSEGAAMPGIVANITAYDQGEAWLEAVLAYLDRNRRVLTQLVAEHLPGVRYQEPEGTYLALLDFRETRLGGGDPAAALHAQANVVLTPGPACGDAAKGFARLNFGTPLPILEQIVARVGSVLRGQAVRPQA